MEITKRPKEIFPWLPVDDRLNPFYKGIVEFVNKYIDLSNLKGNSKTKEILDPCVGYVKIYSWEMAILDTLLFQRLRNITQLGLANLVYPTLGYSRFEHTIGVLGRLDQVLTRLRDKHAIHENKNNDSDFIEIINSYEIQIRLAAIFHDVGHCIFSHLSESIINKLEGESEKYPSTEYIKSVFKDKFASNNANLSIFEIFSIAILGTTRISEILIENNIKTNLKRNDRIVREVKDLKNVMHHVAKLISGLPIDNKPQTVFLAQLMSSGLDVDKLDYMSREELFSGIKIEMDLQRIFNKIRLYKIDSTKLPNSLKKYTKHFSSPVENSFFVLGIEKGGQFSYEEFCMARLALYEKIYLHKKVRAAESFLKKKLKSFINSNEIFNRAHEWLYLPESLIERQIYTIIKSKIPQGELFPIEEKIDLKLTDIKERKIPYRAFGFGPANSKTDEPTKNEKGEILSEQKLEQIQSIELWETLEGEQKLNELSNKIIGEAISLSSAIKQCQIIDDEDKIRLIEDESDQEIITSTLVIDIPNWRKVQLNPQTLHFEEAGYQTMNWTIPIDRISSYYQLHRILAFVYVHYDYCPLIFLATERVIFNYFDKTKLVFDQNHAISSDVFIKAEKIKKILIEENQYKDFQDLIPLEDALSNSFSKELINNTIDNLSGLECLDDRRLSYLDIENYLRQFEQKLQLPALHLISNIKVLTPRKELALKIKDLSQNYERIGVLPLGNYMNSSSNMYKSLKDLFRANGITELNHKSNLATINNILMIDDNINTGIQCLNIMARLLKCDLNPIRNAKIFLDFEKKGMDGEIDYPTQPFIDEIKHKKFIFVFITGYEKSDEYLKKYLIEYCQMQEDQIDIHIIHKLYDNDKLFSGKNITTTGSLFCEIKTKFDGLCTLKEKENLRDFLTKVGMELVKEEGIVKLYGQPPKDHGLGYSNCESLIIFNNSIPTMTITALWCNGKFNNKEWIPLIPRNGKS